MPDYEIVRQALLAAVARGRKRFKYPLVNPVFDRRRSPVSQGLAVEDLEYCTEQGPQGWVPLRLIWKQQQQQQPHERRASTGSSARAPTKLPVVIFLHATGSSMDSQRAKQEEYAEAGYLTAAIDCRYHGERCIAAKGQDPRDVYEDALVRAWKEGIERPFLLDNVWDLIHLLDYLETRRDVDLERIGVTGTSLGGMHSWLLAAADKRIHAAAPMIGVQGFRWAVDNVAWHARVDSIPRVFAAAANDMRKKAVDTEVVSAVWHRLLPGLLDEYDAPLSLLCIAPRPLLIANGEFDLRCPLKGVVAAYEAAKAVYENYVLEELQAARKLPAAAADPPTGTGQPPVAATASSTNKPPATAVYDGWGPSRLALSKTVDEASDSQDAASTLTTDPDSDQSEQAGIDGQASSQTMVQSVDAADKSSFSAPPKEAVASAYSRVKHAAEDVVQAAESNTSLAAAELAGGSRPDSNQPPHACDAVEISAVVGFDDTGFNASCCTDGKGNRNGEQANNPADVSHHAPEPHDSRHIHEPDESCHSEQSAQLAERGATQAVSSNGRAAADCDSGHSTSGTGHANTSCPQLEHHPLPLSSNAALQQQQPQQPQEAQQPQQPQQQADSQAAAAGCSQPISDRTLLPCCDEATAEFAAAQEAADAAQLHAMHVRSEQAVAAEHLEVAVVAATVARRLCLYVEPLVGHKEVAGMNRAIREWFDIHLLHACTELSAAVQRNVWR